MIAAERKAKPRKCIERLENAARRKHARFCGMYAFRCRALRVTIQQKRDAARWRDTIAHNNERLVSDLLSGKCRSLKFSLQALPYRNMFLYSKSFKK